MEEKKGIYTSIKKGPDYLKETASVPAYGSPEDRIVLDRQGSYTVADLDALPDDIRAELIDGYIYLMSAPRFIHQRMAFQLAYCFETYIRKHGGPCVVAPETGVRIDDDDNSELIPDISVICHPERTNWKTINGAPDLVIEILSPSTRSRDMKLKYGKYMNAGVREYWMIDIDRRKVIVVDNTDADDPQFHIYGFSDKVPVAIYDGALKIDFSEISERLNLD